MSAAFERKWPRMDRPFNSQVLNFTVLVVQSLKHAINSSCSCIVIIVQEIGLPIIEDIEKIVQRHEAKVGIIVVELG